MHSIHLRRAEPPSSHRELRLQVRDVLQRLADDGLFEPRCDAWLSGFCPELSRELGRRGWIGMTWPKRYGGHERSVLERFVVLEELLVFGAPVAAHWIADRQAGPQLVRYGTEEAQRSILPAIVRGECFFAIGMSEPDSGSDLASVRTTATRVDSGWRVTGSKIWTSHADRAHYITVLCRTSPAVDDRHQGLSVLVVDLAAEGVAARPIELMNGHADFNEVTFDSVFVPEHMLLGAEGDGWKVVTGELSLERSGPERILSTFPLFREVVRLSAGDPQATEALGALASELWTLRQLALGVAQEIQDGREPVVQAALVKDLGTLFETEVIEVARRLQMAEALQASRVEFIELFEQALLASPGFTLRGGTSEILRGIVASHLRDGT